MLSIVYTILTNIPTIPTAWLKLSLISPPNTVIQRVNTLNPKWTLLESSPSNDRQTHGLGLEMLGVRYPPNKDFAKKKKKALIEFQRDAQEQERAEEAFSLQPRENDDDGRRE